MDSDSKQLTKEEAIALHDSGEWKKWSHEQRAVFQMNQECLCMPFGVFHEAVEKALGRPVWTHEFGLNVEGLKAELAGKQDAPTMAEIIGLIPAEKLLVVAKD
jgi:hypothetical protein